MAQRSTEEMDAIRAGMMEELGNARLDSFPLDDGRRGRDRERARAQPPLAPTGRAARAAPKANNELGKTWLEAIRGGQFDDLEAHAVKNLDDLGGARVWAANAANIAARTNTILRGVDMMPKPSAAFGFTPRTNLRNHADASRISSLGAMIPVGGSTVVFNAGKTSGPAAARDTGPARTAVNSKSQQQHHHPQHRQQHQQHRPHQQQHRQHQQPPPHQQQRQQPPPHQQPRQQQRRAAANMEPGPARPSAAATATATRPSLAAGHNHVSPAPATPPGTKTFQGQQAVKGGQGTMIPPDTRPHLRPKGPPATPPAHAPPAHAPPAEQAAATARRAATPTPTPTADAAPVVPKTVTETLVLEMQYLSLGHKSAIPGRVSLKLSTSPSNPEPVGGTMTFEIVNGPVREYDIEQCRGARRDSRSVGLILLNEGLSVTHEVLYFTHQDVATEFYLTLSGVCHVFRRARLTAKADEGMSTGAIAAPAETADGPAESQAAAPSTGPATAARSGVLLPLEDEPPIVKSATRELAEMSLDSGAGEVNVACQQSDSASKPQAPHQQPQNKPHQQPQHQHQQQPLRQKVTETTASSRKIPATFAAGLVGMLVGSGQKGDTPATDKPAAARAQPSAAKTPQPAQPKRPELQAATATHAAAPAVPVASATATRSMTQPAAQEEQPKEQPVAATTPPPAKPTADVTAGADTVLGGPRSGAAPSAAASEEEEEPEPPLSPPTETVLGDDGGAADAPVDEAYHAFLSALFTEGQSIEDHDALEQILSRLVELTIHVSGMLTGLGVSGGAEAQDLIRKSVVENFMRKARVRHVAPDKAEEFKTILCDMVAAYNNGVPMSELMGRIKGDDREDLMGQDDLDQESNQPSGKTRSQASSRESSQGANEKSADEDGFGDHLMDREEPAQESSQESGPDWSQKPADRDGSDAPAEDAPAAEALAKDTLAIAHNGVADNDASDSSIRHQYTPQEILGLRANATPRPDQLDRADPAIPRTLPQDAPKLAGPFTMPAHADQACLAAKEKPETNKHGHKDADTAAKYETWLFTDNVKSSTVTGWADILDMAESVKAPIGKTADKTTDREASPGPTKPAPVPVRAPVGAPTRAPVADPVRAPVAAPVAVAAPAPAVAAPAGAPVVVSAPTPAVAAPAPAPAAAVAAAAPVPAPAPAPAPAPIPVPAPAPKADQADGLSPPAKADAKSDLQVEVTIRAALTPGGNVHGVVVLVNGEEASADSSLVNGLVFSALYNKAVKSTVSDTTTTAPAANNKQGGGGLKNSMWAN